MAHTPLKVTIEEAHDEVKHGWAHAYSPEALSQAVDALDDQPLGYRVNIFLARLCFRGIYFPMMGRLAWVKVIAQNRRTIYRLVKEALLGRRTLRKNPDDLNSRADAMAPSVPGEITVSEVQSAADPA